MKKVYIFPILVFMVTTVQAQVEFIAHRGASFLAPENTLASNKLAWELGADAVELDIHLSKDKKLMVIHDSNTKKVSGRSFKVSITNSHILRSLDVGSYKGEKYKGEKIPFVEELIRIIPPGKKLVIELKSRKETIPWLKKVIEKCDKVNQLVFICFDWETILETKLAFKNNDCYWLCSNKKELLNKMEDASKFGLKGVDVKYTAIDLRTMEYAKRYNLDVIAYTVDEPEEAKRLIELGVSGITTNRPAWLKEQLITIEK